MKLDYSKINYNYCVYCQSQDLMTDRKNKICYLPNLPKNYVDIYVQCRTCEKYYRFHEISISVIPKHVAKIKKELDDSAKHKLREMLIKEGYIYNDVSYIKKGMAESNFDFVKNFLLSTKDIFSYKNDIVKLKEIKTSLKNKFDLDLSYCVYQHRLGYSKGIYLDNYHLNKIKFLKTLE